MAAPTSNAEIQNDNDTPAWKRSIVCAANAVTTALIALLFFVGLMIILVPIQSGFMVIYDDGGDDAISVLLRKDTVDSVGVSTCQVMILLWYLQRFEQRHVLAAGLLTIYVMLNGIVTIWFVPTTVCRDTCHSDSTQSAMLILIPALTCWILWKFENQDPPLLSNLKQRYSWMGNEDGGGQRSDATTGHQKSLFGRIALIVFALAVILQLVMVGFLFSISLFNVDIYHAEPELARQARTVEAMYQSSFGCLAGVTLILIGPSSVSLGVLLVASLITIVQGWYLLAEIQTIIPRTNENENVVDDFYEGVVAFSHITVVLFVGFLCQLVADYRSGRRTASAEEQIPILGSNEATTNVV